MLMLTQSPIVCPLPVCLRDLDGMNLRLFLWSKLPVIDLGVQPACLEEGVVGASLACSTGPSDDFPAVEHENLVRLPDGAEALGDDE